MEALRHSLFAPAGSTFLLVIGAATAIQEMVTVRYSAKDDEGKWLYTHPYRPWIEIDPKYKEQGDKAFRAFKMCENVKEWTLFSMPLVWIVGLFGSSLPYIEDSYVNYFLGLTSVVYTYANYRFIHGYMESPQKRLDGFYLRMKVWQVWMFGSAVSLLGYGIKAAGIF